MTDPEELRTKATDLRLAAWHLPDNWLRRYYAAARDLDEQAQQIETEESA